MVKIKFPADMAADGVVESMHAEVVVDGLQLMNSPFYVYGISFHDVVSAIAEDGFYLFTSVVRRGCHSTYRVLVKGEQQIASFPSRWRSLEALGCTYEESRSDGRRLYAVDMGPGVDVAAAYAVLEGGEEVGAWEFEEGHYYAGAP